MDDRLSERNIKVHELDFEGIEIVCCRLTNVLTSRGSHDRSN